MFKKRIITGLFALSLFAGSVSVQETKATVDPTSSEILTCLLYLSAPYTLSMVGEFFMKSNAPETTKANPGQAKPQKPLALSSDLFSWYNLGAICKGASYAIFAHMMYWSYDPAFEALITGPNQKIAARYR